MIICDTREKKWEHIKKYFLYHNIRFDVKKLDYGDYADSDNPTFIIDRKRNLDEVAQNLCSPDSSRFWREIRGAHKNGIKLAILIEHGGQYRSVMDCATWRSKYSRLTGQRLVENMLRVAYAYDVEWIFCDKRSTGRIILEQLEKHK